MAIATEAAAPAPGWAVWDLPRPLRAYVLGTMVAWALAIAYALTVTPVRGWHLETFAVLILAGALAIECRRRLGEAAGVKLHDLLSAWWLPVMALLPPAYALVAPVLLLAVSQWRVRTLIAHRRVFSAGVIGLAYAGASVAFHQLAGGDPVSAGRRPGWWLLFAVCGLLATEANAVLVSVAVRISDRQTTWRELLLDKERCWLDVVELSAGLIVTLALTVSQVLVVAVLPVLVMLQRSFMHTQLSAAARLEGKTGLLNAVTWERETEVELARLRRTRQSAAVMLIDIDHFKAVNDAYGHLTGDRVLVAVAEALSGGLRDGDLLSRFGGDEFAVLLPHADLTEARLAAERLRQRVADLGVFAPDLTGATLSISIGVSVTGAARLGVVELLAAADAALYAAKAAGRNRVHHHHASRAHHHDDQQDRQLPALLPLPRAGATPTN